MTLNSVDLKEAASAIACGELIAYQTETFFGLAADPRSQKAVDAICSVKSRRLGAGIPLILASTNDFKKLLLEEEGEHVALRDEILSQFWPGALTAVITSKSSAESGICPEVYGPDDSLAVRVSSDAAAIELATACGGMITSTSANPQGEAPARSAQEVVDYFPDLKILCALDINNPCGSSELPSTIVDFRSHPFIVLRQGAVSNAELIDFAPQGFEL